MIFENRRPGNVEIDESSIGLYFNYNVEQLIYKSEIIDDIIKYDTDSPMLEVMAGLGQVSFDILSKSSGKNVVMQEDKELYIQHMKDAIEKEHIGDRCTAILSPSNQLPFDGETFQLVYSINGLHRMEHPVETICEMYRVLKPGGKIILSDLRRDLIEDFTDYRIKELQSVQNADWMIKNFLNSWGASYTLAETEQLMKEAQIPSFQVAEDGVVALIVEILK